MSIEKSFIEFIQLHERSLMTKEVDLLENDLISVTNRASSILGALGGEELKDVTSELMDSFIKLRQILFKHQLYEIKTQ